MRKDILAVIGLVIILAVLVGVVSTPFIIHGYDSPIARITEMDDRYEENPIFTQRHIADNFAYAYPVSPDYLDLFTECGVRLEIKSAPNVIGTPEVIDTITEVVVDDVAKTNMTRNWDVHKVKCSMGATAWTYEGGIAKCGQITFWVTLSANPSSIFMDLDEHYDFFVNVYNIDPVVIVGEMEVTPTATGDYIYDPVETDAVPQWILDSGYTGQVNNHRSIKFPITILNAEPSAIGIWRTEASATFHIGIDVILIGYWEQTVDYRDWKIPTVPDILGDLIAFFTLFAWVILGFLATILIFRFVPDIKMKLFATGIVWFVLLAIYGINAITVWLGGAG